MLKAVAALAVGAALAACAAINTETMSPACRDNYNECLNRCPSAPSVDPSSPGFHEGLYVGTAYCTEECNHAAKACK